MTRRRTLLAAAVALVAAGTAGAGVATADTTPAPSRVHVANDDYIACVAIDTVNVGTCLRDPVRPIVDLIP